MDNFSLEPQLVKESLSTKDLYGQIFSNILSAINAHYWIFDTSKKTFFLPDSIKSFLGLQKKSKITFVTFASLIHHDDKSLILKKITQILKKQNTEDLYYRLIKEENQIINIKNSFIKQTLPSGETVIISILQDITEQVKREEQLNIQQKTAEKNNKEKSNFLATMAHEMRAPMNGIIGFAELLENKNLTIDKRHKYTSIIKNSSRHLMSLLSDILSISKLEANQLTINITKCNLSQLFSELELHFLAEKRRLNKENISINFPNISKNINVIYTDNIKLKQILINLIENALKYTNEGYISIGIEKRDDESFQFNVCDTGVGIPNEKRDCVFKRFIRLHSVHLNEKPTGTGLGLSITKGLVEILGGKITFASKINQGTTFYFSLPINPINDELISSNINNEAMLTVN